LNENDYESGEDVPVSPKKDDTYEIAFITPFFVP